MKSLIFLIMFMSGLANAQIPQTLSYQGVLTDVSGSAVTDGNYSLIFKLYESATSGPLIWEETQGVTVANGIFNVILGSSTALNLPFDKQYWLGIAVDGGSELQPRIQLTSAAYSLNARSVADSAVTGAAIANGSVVRSLNSFTEEVNLVAGDNVTVTNSGNTVVISTTEARLSLPFGGRVDEPSTLFSISNDGLGGVAGFQIFNENSTAPALDVTHRGVGVAGTFDVTKSDNLKPALQASTKGQGPVILVEHKGSAGNLAEFKTPSGRQFTISRDGNITAAGDLEIGGKIIFADDTEQATAASANGASTWLLTGNAGIDTSNFIGTLDNFPFEIKVNNARGFRLEPAVSGTFFSPNVIGGFAGNEVTNGAIGATISGGGFVGGGAVGFSAHQISADFGAIGGGTRNIISASSGTVSGGIANTVSGVSAVIGGGSFNQALSDQATVAGGIDNTASGDQSFIGGGRQNAASAQYAVIAGGEKNVASDSYATVGGGESNQASVDHATVSGGKSNKAENFFATVSGGELNRVFKSYGTIGGGKSNSSEANFATVSGGELNKAIGLHATIGGGELNTASEIYTTVSGGKNNAASYFYDTIGGGRDNVVKSSESGAATIGGGDTNQAIEDFATVSGGRSNTASGTESTVSGGDFNRASSNYSTVGGGRNNIASNQGATVPGGRGNHARGSHSFAAGYHARAIHNGSFVWNDRSITSGKDSLVSTANNQFLIRATGGVGIGTNSPSFPLEMGSGAHVTAGGVWTNASSRTYKEKITNLFAEEALLAFQNLNPVKYKYKNIKDEEYVGFIAEDVPELVATKDRKSLSLMDIVAIMTKVVQQQQAVISQLQERMTELEKRE